MLAANITRPINCVLTDPPYGVSYRSRHATTPDGKHYVEDVHADDDLDGAVALFRDVMDAMGRSPGGFADECELYVFTRWDIVDTWMNVVRTLGHGFRYKMLLVWDKMEPGTGDIDTNWGCGHELILYGKRGKRDVNMRRGGVIAHPKVPPQHIIHPTEKPVRLLEKLLEVVTDEGDLVVDPFGGSLSTARAAANLNRDFVTIEQNAEFVRRGKQRLDQGTLF